MKNLNWTDTVIIIFLIVVAMLILIKELFLGDNLPVALVGLVGAIVGFFLRHLVHLPKKQGKDNEINSIEKS